MVIWIIGKSGSGKSYLAKSLVRCLKKKSNNVFWIDGDKFRKKYSKDLGYSIRDRRINSKRIQKYCKIKEKLDKVVVCSILSIFINHQKQNKKIFDKYFQVYVDAKTNIIEKRNNKKIYNKKYNVVGKDIKFPKPHKSNIIIKNNFDNNFLINIKEIINKINV